MAIRSMEYLLATPAGLLGVSRTGVAFRVFYLADGRRIRSDAGWAIPWWVAWPRTPVERAGPALVQAHVRNALASGPDAHPLRFTLEGDAGRAGRWSQHVERRAESPGQTSVYTVRDEPVGGGQVPTFRSRPARMLRLTVAGANSAQTVEHLRVRLDTIPGGETD